MKPKLGALLTHPVQYYSPWFPHLAEAFDLSVFYAHRQTPEGHARAGFGAAFDWDVPLLEGYDWRFLDNVAARPGLGGFGGCDTPGIGPIIRGGGFDAFMMFGWNRKCFLQAGWAAARSGTPLLIRLDSQLGSPRPPLVRWIKRPAYSAILPFAAHYLSPGRRTDAYLGHYAVPASRIHRLAHMVDTERFAGGAEAARSSGASQALRARHGAGEGDFVFLLAAKLIAKKRPLLLLQALQHLRAASPETATRARVWIAGDGPLRAELEAFAGVNGLPAAFLGFVNQAALPQIYAAADCLVLPSNAEETWGLVVNEAFACGLPAIVSAEAGCAPELIINGRTGWTLNDPSAGALAARMAAAVDRGRHPDRAELDRLTREASYGAGVERMRAIVASLSRRGSPEGGG